jgi:lipopolysaccharide/colanic/teichoic acid biosynthesis glycosyltransferase
MRLRWVDAPRQALRPGITGPAQLLGGRGKEHSALVEDNYARQGSLRLDAEVVALSFLVNIAGKYRIKTMLRDGRLGRRTAALDVR